MSSSVTIEYHGMRATVSGGEWASDNVLLADFLNSQSQLLDIPTSEPFKDYVIAQDIVNRFHAVIIDVVKPTTERGRVY